MCVNIAPLQTHYRKIEGALHFHARKRWEVCVFVCDDYPFVSTQKVVLQGGNYHTHTHSHFFVHENEVLLQFFESVLQRHNVHMHKIH